MPDDQFAFMREVLAAPSPIGLEAAMSYGVLKPYFEKLMPKSWEVQQFKGNAGIVVDTHPGQDLGQYRFVFALHAGRTRGEALQPGSQEAWCLPLH